MLPNNFNVQIAFKGTKLNSCFKIKDIFNFGHKHDLVYYGNCPTNNCNDYVVKQVKAFQKVFKTSLKHYMEKERQCLPNKGFVILRSGFPNNTVKRKISEAFQIKDLRLILKRQKKSIELKLFN